jgi:hypothetical protein
VFERFLAAFTVTEGAAINTASSVSSVSEWMATGGGRSFEGGLYRVHSIDSGHAADILVGEAFPEFVGRFRCFGYDWLGRQYAIDFDRGKTDDPAIIMFEPGTGEALEIPVLFSEFHDQELVDFGEESLARSFYSEWCTNGGISPGLRECVGYIKPLFLGGVDDVENLELSDSDVYWTIMGQLRMKVRMLSEGTLISEVKRKL